MKMLGIWIHENACYVTDLYVFMCLDFGERFVCESSNCLGFLNCDFSALNCCVFWFCTEVYRIFECSL